MFRLAHLSDPHIGPLPPARLRELANKRLLGYLSWQRRRRLVHRPEVLKALVADLRETAPDHVAVTGDLTNIALPAEFAQARTWLHTLGPPERITVIPGNHDAYVAVPWAQSLACWQCFMSEDPDAGAAGPAFPFLRRRGPIALIGLSTACPSTFGLATGRLGDRQLGALADLLPQQKDAGLFRCVLLHHSPIAGAVTTRKRLTDQPAFAEVIARQGAELILHGHDHTSFIGAIPGPKGPVPVYGAPSASAVAHGVKPAARYYLFEIEARPAGWHIALQQRGYDAGNGRFGPFAGPQLAS